MRLPAVLAACLLTVCAGASAATSVPAAPATPLAAHHALYKLKLDNSKGGDVVAANGTMGYEVIDACDGWAVRQRLQLTITNADGQDIQMMSDYATWESKDGLQFRFHMKQTTDTAVTSQTDGVAKLDSIGGTGEAHYTRPRRLGEEAAGRHAVPDGAHRGDHRRRARGQEVPGAAAVRRHRRGRRRGQLDRDPGLEAALRHQVAGADALCRARASTWRSSTTRPMRRRRTTRWPCATGRTASATT